MTIYLGADHRGFGAKQDLLNWLKSSEHKVIDCGAINYDIDDDFPDYAFAVADAVAADPSARGIVLCGKGTGVLIAANKVPGIRCGFAATSEIVQTGREHDDINVLAVPADVTPPEELHQMVSIFLNTDFKNEERLKRRLEKVASRERTQA